MIRFDQVSVTFPLGNTALNNVSFEIADNDFVFLVGKSGAGKTTILKLLLREYLPSTGTIMVDDKEISARRIGKLHKYRQSLGVIFQDFKILPDRNVLENIAISLRVQGVRDADVREQVLESLQLVGLPGKELLFPAQLSAGELQRVAIARALSGNRDIILADEPTGNLDPKTTWEIMKIFKKIQGSRTVIFATHNSDIVNSFRKRVLVLKDGILQKDIRKGGYDL
ncbi:MAG: ATP-binding cassette domain-containing protein [Patescibacteria group bacterium]|nr:ATP-binding cassette domain-containing protein [Patescibacteria group bacterium]